jgi:hypothetical protein
MQPDYRGLHVEFSVDTGFQYRNPLVFAYRGAITLVYTLHRENIATCSQFPLYQFAYNPAGSFFIRMCDIKKKETAVQVSHD